MGLFVTVLMWNIQNLKHDNMEGGGNIDDDEEDEETYDDEDDDDDDFHLKTGESWDSNSLVGPDDRLLGGNHISGSGHIGDCKEASAAKIDLIHRC